MRTLYAIFIGQNSVLMLKLENDNALTRSQVAKKAKKKIPLYDIINDYEVKVPFLDKSTNKQRYLRFCWRDGEWHFTKVVD
jgi:hypothetical protein